MKPGNMLVSADGQVKILDLGLARFLQDHVEDGTLTREGTGMGTPDYMPPEQFRDARHVDGRSDIYSLGCTLYHLLTGRVPFPGSSMTEKYAAHEQQLPTPVEELCPEVPAGLALAVQRMMAKRPEDRFQSAREVAEALFPHVAGSSSSIIKVRPTASWHGSQLDISVGPLASKSRSRRRVFGAAVTAALAVIVLSLWAAGMFRPGLVENHVSDDPNVLTVAKNNTGQFKTIGEALNSARPGITIRVLDDATYSESFTIDDPARHEGITLSAEKNAIIELPAAADELTVRGVAGVCLRGFRIREGEPKTEQLKGLVSVSGRAPGVVLENLDVQARGVANAILISARNADGDKPLIVRHNALRGALAGVYLSGARGLRLEDNSIVDCTQGTRLEFEVVDVQISGNMMGRCTWSAVEMCDLEPSSQGILLANNTLYDSDVLFRIFDYHPYEDYRQGQVELRNNLLFGARRVDIALFQSTNNVIQIADGSLLSRLWNFRDNWRETGGISQDKGLPLGLDTTLDDFPFESRNPGDSSFLRPLPNSKLCTDGAGNTDSSLPRYVGAVPPKATQPWSWQTTWDARHAKLTEPNDPNLLTVAKDGSGRYASIGDALAAVARPGMTIRVLDAEKYTESNATEIRRKVLGELTEATLADEGASAASSSPSSRRGRRTRSAAAVLALLHSLAATSYA